MHNLNPGSKAERTGVCATSPRGTKSMLLMLQAPSLLREPKNGPIQRHRVSPTGAPLPPTPKIHHSGGVFTFSVGSRFWAVFEQFFDTFFLRSGNKNILKYSVFALFAYRNSILQHGESCVNTNVFARHRHKNIVNTVIFATRGKNHRKYRGFGFPRRRKHRYLRCFCSERVKKMRKHHLCDDF